MKTYNKTKEQKNRKSLLALIIGLVLIACAVIITLCVTLTNGPAEEVGNINPPINDPAPKYVMPLGEYTMGKVFSDKLVYNQTLKQWRTHNGVDFMAEKGTEVMAVFGGKVLSVENTTLEGTVIAIEQTDGIVTTYKSLSADVKVAKDDEIEAGTVIGYVDVTMATEKKEGAHLHLEMKKDGAYVSPLDYLPEGSDK